MVRLWQVIEGQIITEVLKGCTKDPFFNIYIQNVTIYKNTNFLWVHVSLWFSSAIKHIDINLHFSLSFSRSDEIQQVNRNEMVYG